VRGYLTGTTSTSILVHYERGARSFCGHRLPDGMQAYMLVDATGRRIDKAPQAIVSDPRRPDRAVETALSCMGCHAAGIIDHADQVRAATGAELYGQLTAQLSGDRARFTDALATLHLVPTDVGDERITALAARYESELDLRLAAAELGLTASELAARLPRSTQQLGALASGGSVKRDLWAVAFPRLLGELGIGVPYTPASSRDAAPAVWIDRARHTWLALNGRADQATAAARCRAAGMELPRADELQRAMAQGLGAALHVERTAWSAGAKLDASNQRYASAIDSAGIAHRADVAEAHAILCVLR